jgi:nucleotide-binding universal stress UspA family protein
MMDNIVVGIDGSKSAQTAARWAATQAQQSGARVVAVYAVPRTELWSLSAVQVNIDELLAEMQGNLDGPWTAPLRKAGVEHTTQLVRGDPATELLRAAKRARASMLVLGSKGHGALADLVVGGTVHKVINRSNIPVVLVPASTPAKKAASPRKATTRRSSRS